MLRRTGKAGGQVPSRHVYRRGTLLRRRFQEQASPGSRVCTARTTAAPSLLAEERLLVCAGSRADRTTSERSESNGGCQGRFPQLGRDGRISRKHAIGRAPSPAASDDSVLAEGLLNQRRHRNTRRRRLTFQAFNDADPVGLRTVLAHLPFTVPPRD
jgi:hypothetical protein